MKDLIRQLEKLEAKIDKISDSQFSMSTTLIRQQVVLEEHQRRSLANEEAVSLIRDEIKPIKKHVEFMNTAAKLASVLAAALVSIHKLGYL